MDTDTQMPSPVAGTSDQSGIHKHSGGEGAFEKAWKAFKDCGRNPPAWAICVLLDYNQETGEFRWKVRPRSIFKRSRDFIVWNARYAGMIAGAEVRVHRAGMRDIPLSAHISIGKVRFKSHRLAWILVNGNIPPLTEVDHKDRNPLNNRIENLRLCTHGQNVINKTKRRSRHQYRGVRPLKGGQRWSARIVLDKREMHIGCFATEVEAARAYDASSLRIHGEFGVRNFPTSALPVSYPTSP